MNTQQLLSQVNEMLRSGKHDEMKTILLDYKDITEHDNDLAVVCYLCTIHEREKAAGQQTLFSKVTDVDELLERYTILKFYLRRIDFGVIDEMESFFQFLSWNHISSYELLGVIDFSVVHKESVLRSMRAGVTTKTQKQEMEMDTDNGRGEGSIVLQEEQEICFILCTNNRLYAQECIYYIEHLEVPEGIHTDIIAVEEAQSLAAAYNEAMRCSKAKYKVYLHQDTFIINPHFIYDCLQIFQKDSQIGMIGNIGCRTMPVSGVMWDADRYGMLYEQHIYETELLANAIDAELKYLEVDAIDGFIMVTQYDLPWREDLFDGWDFYDCSQSMEFRRKGYKVVVPNMKKPWCVHDCGFINLQNYDMEKEKFIAEYLKG